jgi:3-oxoacyl-[acyl-carrier-protein] synthase II
VVLGRADADAADATTEPSPAAATTGPAHNPSANESSSPNDVVLTGIGLVTPDGHGEDALQALHANALRDQPPPPIDPDALGQLVQARRVRRMSDYVKLSLAATRLAMEHAGLDQAALDNPRTGALLGTTHGSADYCAQYYHQIVAEGIDAANAMLFAEGVPNAAAAHLSLSIGLTGPCQTLIGARTAGLEALHLAALRIAEGRWDRAIVAAAEEATDHIRAVYHHCGLHADRQGGGPFGPVQGFVLGSGAATLVLARREVAEQRGTPIFGTITAAGTAFHQSGRMREAAHQWQGLVETLGHPGAFISSANSTWPGRIEAAAIGLAAAGETPTVTSLYGHLAETFAVGPLAALGVAARTGRLPALHGEPPPGPVTPAANGTPAEDFAVLATDYEGPLAAVRFRRA